MEILDSRRLTGPNLQTRVPAAIAEIAFASDEPVDAAIEAWRAALARMLGALGWHSDPFVRIFRDRSGAAIGFSAPFDVLYAATEINEWAISEANAVLAGRGQRDLERGAERIRTMIAEEARPDVVALVEEAHRRDVPELYDEDGFTLGLGAHSITWALDGVPTREQVPWDRLGSIPTVAVTGTNGKTTCARWIARTLQLAGFIAGNTSTDGISLDGRTIEDGDCTGPGAARRLLRRTELQIAVLEAARGGLLRRGFALPRCDVALVTNVGNDHIGEFGILDIEELAQVKAIVGHLVHPGGRVVLGADSDPVTRMRGRFAAPEVWFSLRADHPLVLDHLGNGGEAWWVEDRAIVHGAGDHREQVIGTDDIELSLGGVAVHNLANALAVCAVVDALGIPRPTLVRALQQFGRDPHDNPGRLERYDVGGVQVVLDFAHNLDGLRRQAEVIAALRHQRSGRFLVSFGMAGDRSDEMLAALAHEIAAMGPDRVIVRDMPDYLRGRVLGEVPDILRRAFVDAGVPPSAIDQAADERASVAHALAWARPGDTIAVFCHTEREPLW
ncbi:MAG: Mur ligase [Deltaproteobacteria bacterium]|nr:Mur ligase [Nannocystaceae bacterium]